MNAHWFTTPISVLVVAIAILSPLSGCAGAGKAPQTNGAAAASPATSTSDPKMAAIDEAIRKGVAFLVKTQNPDGSWGTGLETRGTEVYSMVPGSHDAFRVATTALCVMALREVGERTSHDKGLEYLVDHGEARRDTPDLMYNIWTHIYALQALSTEVRTRAQLDPKIKEAALWHLDHLKRYEVFSGGWNYYDFFVGAQQPAMGATSFSTSAGLVALFEARRAGLDVPQGMIDRAQHRLTEMRLPNGAYLYAADHKYHPLHPANRIRGSVGRSQAGNYALWIWSAGGIDEAKVRDGLEMFFREHDYINMGRRRPYPHESWYATAPYYYYFGHYYTGLLLEKLGPEARKEFGGKLAEVGVLPHQEPDGSWWDYAMWDYHKPYGTAFSIMTLLRCR